MQLCAIEFARNVLNLKDASSTEFDENTSNPVITILDDKANIVNKGGTLRLGLYNCTLKDNTLAYSLYNKKHIQERHRHRYEFNNAYLKSFEENGLIASGINEDKNLVEILELKNHPYFIASQFHPEFLSRPNRPHPLFYGFIKNSIEYQNKKNK